MDSFLDADLPQINSSCQGLDLPLDNTQEQENMWNKLHNPEHLNVCSKSLKLWRCYHNKADKCWQGRILGHSKMVHGAHAEKHQPSGY